MLERLTSDQDVAGSTLQAQPSNNGGGVVFLRRWTFLRV